jgi:hypothetical protein
MDEPEDMVDEVSKAEPVRPSHPPKGGGEARSRDDAEAPVADVAGNPAAPAEGASDGAMKLEPAPRLYRLRAPGLRPAPRPRRGPRAAKLRSDCPPDFRGEGRPDTRTRLR